MRRNLSNKSQNAIRVPSSVVGRAVELQTERETLGIGSASERAERLSDLLVLLSHEPIFAWKLDGTIKFWGAGAEQLYGFPANEAIDNSSHALLQTKFPIKFAELRASLQNGHHWSGELRHIRKDGREVIVDSRMQLLDDGTVLEVNRDITALRESEQLLRWLASIVESSDDAIVSKNLDGIIRSWNRGAERIFGYTAEEAIGKPITMVIPAERHAEESAILERLRRGERIEHFETVRQRKHGSLIVVSLTISPVRDVQGKIVGASKVARDITEQKRAAEQIAMLAREAEHRTKNVLATVQATVNLSYADTPDDLKRTIEGRIQALANAHTLFVESRWAGAELAGLVRQELSPYLQNADERAQMEGPQLLLEPSLAQVIAIILHELATNAAKYGALSVEHGKVDIKWSLMKDGRLVLRWNERGGPPVQPPTRRGFGIKVMERSIKDQNRGKIRLDWRPEGLVCEIAVRI
jgi:PAS domain S-box-containing protein